MRSKGPHMSPKPLPMNLTARGGGQAKGQMTHLIFLGWGTSQGMGLKPSDWGSHTHSLALS